MADDLEPGVHLAASGVLAIDATPDLIWLATASGLVCGRAGGWLRVPGSQALPPVGAVKAIGPEVWAAGLDTGLYRSGDGGAAWESCWTDQVDAPVTCLLPSPLYADDRTLLAGTAGAGVLRSTDGGRRWWLANFGLEDFTVLVLAAAGAWRRREVVFAGSAGGIFRSSGGGRAWKRCGLAGHAVQALAAGPTPATDDIVLAGTEGDGLFRSIDAGRTWQRDEGPLGNGVAVNGLAASVSDAGIVWLAGTGDGELWRSVDGGEHWQRTFSASQPLLALAGGVAAAPARGAGESAAQSPASGFSPAYAGFAELGLAISSDGGVTWAPDPTLQSALQPPPAG